MRNSQELSSTAATRGLSEIVSRAAYGRERVTITRYGRPLVVIMPATDAAALARYEAQEGAQLAAQSAPQLEAAPLPAPAPVQPQPPPPASPVIAPAPLAKN
jgi:prevent-host-death family protein